MFFCFVKNSGKSIMMDFNGFPHLPTFTHNCLQLPTIAHICPQFFIILAQKKAAVIGRLLGVI